MALLPFGLDFIVKNAAWAQTQVARFETAVKRTSKSFVDTAEKSLRAAIKQERLTKAQAAGLPVLKSERDALKLLRAQMATTRAEQALATAESGRQARAYYALGIALGVVSAALIKFNSNNLKASLGVEKSSVALEVLTENMSVNRDLIEAEIAELQELNLTRGESTRLIARLISAELDLTQASDIRLAGIRASVISTLSWARATEVLTDAIINMTPRQLRQLDLGQRANRMFDTLAKSMELDAQLLTERERRQAILNAVIQRTNKLQGVENKLLESGTGQLEIYNFQVKQLQQNFGEALLPSWIEVLKTANAFSRWLRGLPKDAQKAISTLTLLAGAILSVSSATVVLLAGLRTAGFAVFAAKLAAALPTIGLVVAGLAALAIAIGGVIKLIKDLRGAPIDEAVDSLERINKALIMRPFVGPERELAEQFVRWFRRVFGEVEDEAAQAGRRTGEAFVEGLIEGIDSQIRRIDVDLSLLEKSFETQRLKAQLVLIPLQQQEKSLQRSIVLLQREADAAEELAEGPLKNAQAQLDLLNDISKDLDRSLQPYEFALRRVEASAAEILIPLRAQERSLQRQLDLLQRRIALERRSLENVHKAAELSLRGIEDQVYALDKALWPLRDAFTQISADADLVLIPLRRQRREIERQIDRMERLSEIEQKRIERHLRALEKQRDALQDIIDTDRKRLDIVNHEIFMEQQRNRILQRVTSARFLTMESQAAVMQDQLAIRQQEMKALNKQTKNERERLRDIRDVLDEQLEPLRERLQMLVDAITLEEDRVTFARENLRLEEARQTAARIALEQQRRMAEEEVKQAQRRLDAFDELAEQRTRALEDELLAIGDLIFQEETRIQNARDALELARLRQTETRIALETEISLWEDIRDLAETHAEIIKQDYDARIRLLKDQLTVIQDIIYEKETELGFMQSIKDMTEATLKLEKEQLEVEKKRLETLEKIMELPLIMKGGATTGAAATPTVPAPVPAPTPPIIVVPTGTPGPTIQLEAHYSDTQSPATIVDDVELMLSYAR